MDVCSVSWACLFESKEVVSSSLSGKAIGCQHVDILNNEPSSAKRD